MDEDAFLRSIRNNPTDDARRLIYADWLDEQGEADRAAYLRLACALPPGDPRRAAPNEALAKLLALAEKAAFEWEQVVCRPYAVVLETLPQRPALQRAAVAAIAQATGLSLQHSQELTGATPQTGAVSSTRGLPKVIVQGLTFQQAERVAHQIHNASGAKLRLLAP